MGSEPAAADAKVYVLVISFAGFVVLVEPVEEVVAALGVVLRAGDGEVVDEEAENAVVLVRRLMDEAARVCW